MDITLQMSYVEGRWPQNCDRSKPTDYFTKVTQKLVKICIFFIKRSAPENFQRENFSKGVPTETLRTHGSEYVIKGVGDRGHNMIQNQC